MTLTLPQLQILGDTRAPFAVQPFSISTSSLCSHGSQVKSGGHAMNPNFSSTTGVQIAMYRFNQVIYDPKTKTAEVGSGLVWDDVYAALAPYNVSVVGGRAPGIGVAGFTLGGGQFPVVCTIQAHAQANF